MSFIDRLQGPQRQRLADEVGDFVVKRADGLFAYQLAVVVDDAEQCVTDVVRGADLLASTPRQIHLARLLGCHVPTYLHVPVAVDREGQKLSKQTRAPALPDDPLPALARRVALPRPAAARHRAPRRGGFLAPRDRRVVADPTAAGADAARAGARPLVGGAPCRRRIIRRFATRRLAHRRRVASRRHAPSFA